MDVPLSRIDAPVRTPARTRGSQRRGFTLVELLVVVGIIAVLISVLMPSLTGAWRASRQTACMSNLRQLGLAFTLYVNDYHGIYPAGDDKPKDPAVPPPAVWAWMGRGFRPLLEKPYAARVAGGPGIFWCPSDDNAVQAFDSTSYAYSMAFYHSPEQINSITTTAGCYTGPLPTITQKVTAVRHSSTKVLAGEWNSPHYPFRTDKGWFGPGGKRSYLFADGHVEPLRSTDVRLANDNMPNPNLTVDGIKGTDLR